MCLFLVQLGMRHIFGDQARVVACSLHYLTLHVQQLAGLSHKLTQAHSLFEFPVATCPQCFGFKAAAFQILQIQGLAQSVAVQLSNGKITQSHGAKTLVICLRFDLSHNKPNKHWLSQHRFGTKTMDKQLVTSQEGGLFLKQKNSWVVPLKHCPRARTAVLSRAGILKRAFLCVLHYYRQTR